MSYKHLPVKIYIVENCNFTVATVERMDYGLASVEFHCEITPCSWPEISAEIQEALNTVLAYCDD